MKKIAQISFIAMLILSACQIANAQTYVKQADGNGHPKVTIRYDANKGGNRPNASIEFADSYQGISWLNAVCPGDYSWCVRDHDDNDMASLKFTFSGNKLIVDIIIDSNYPKENLDDTKKLHLNALKGTYTKSSQ